MTVLVYNDATATFPDQAEPDQQDFVILSGHSGVMSGCAVTANGTNMNLAIAAGIAHVNGLPVIVGGGSVTIGAASANPRWDMVVVNSSGVASVLTGTPASSNATLPTVDTTQFAALSAVFIPTSTAVLASGNLVDKSKPITVSMERIEAATSTVFLRSKVSGDSTDRYKVTADGKAVWTSGSAGTPAPQLAFDGTLGGLLATGKFGTTSSAATDVPLTTTGTGGQSADLFQVRNSTPSVLMRVDPSGILTARNIQRGTGAPNTVVTGFIGDIYMQTDGAAGATLWIKESGNNTNTGWNASGTTSAGLVLGGGQIPTSAILEWSCSVLPGGFLWCDGAAQSRATFSALNALYAADGYPWGAGNGSTTFNVPDKRGVVTAGAQSFGTTGLTGDGNRQIGGSIGATIIGERLHTLSSGEVPNETDSGHAHQQFGRSPTGTVPINPAGGPTGFEVETINSAAGYPNVANGFAAITPGGGNGSHNNVQPTQLSRYIVKF